MYGWDGCRLAAAVGAADMTMDKMQGVVLLHAQHANQEITLQVQAVSKASKPCSAILAVCNTILLTQLLVIATLDTADLPVCTACKAPAALEKPVRPVVLSGSRRICLHC